MSVFEEFLWANRLKQADVKRYLGVSSAYISKVCSDKISVSQLSLVKLINNPHGWDTSMLLPLVEDEYRSFISSSQPSALGNEDETEAPTPKREESESSGSSEDSWYKMMFMELSKRVTEQDALISKLQERIKELENR